MLELANLLHTKGFSITLIHTSFNSPNPSNYPHFTFHSVPSALSETEASTNEEPVACLISDALFHFTQAVAKSFKLPRIILRTGGALSFVVFAAFPLLREKGYLPIEDSKVEEQVVELPPLKVKDLRVIKTPNLEKFYKLVDLFTSVTKAFLGIIWNTFDELKQSALIKISTYFSIPNFPIGPFHKFNPVSSSSSTSSLFEVDYSSISWLNSQAPKFVIYVSFGSISTALSIEEYLEIAWGIANSKRPPLWVVRLGSVHVSEWLEPLPKGFMENLSGRGHIVKWAPQKEVLAHPSIRAFWTHNGWNSTLESICEGVPMICSPCFSDQMVNARFVSHIWKVGLQLENGMEREEIEKTIRNVIDEKQGEEIRKRVQKLKEMANSCLEQGGTSYQSLESLIGHILSLESFTFQT
ncbi:hypothetical protein UlMin_025536 [Ulmus minor]